jgi:flavin-dependent dehydrogenase
MTDYRVIIIGAGPGGAILARELAGQGITVDLYERSSYEELGHDWSDAVETVALKAAGLPIPRLEGLNWVGELVKETPGAPGIFEKHAVPRLLLCSPGLVSCKEVNFKMITTDRRRLGQLLIDQALENGAKIHFGYEGRRLLFKEKSNFGPDSVTVSGVTVTDLESGEEKELEAELVVESSGFKSVLRTSLPLSTGLADQFTAADYALVHREVRPYDSGETGENAVPDYYRYGFHAGYQWSHIHNETTIDIGAGVKNVPGKPDPQALIEEYIGRHPAIKGEKLRGGRSLCIVGRPLTNFVTNGFLVIGDAASTSVPTTGCGVGSAILAALWAAAEIVKAAGEGRNDLQKLWPINTKFFLTQQRGASFAALTPLRSMLQTLTHAELDFLFTHDLLDAETLENAINGKFILPNLRKKIKAFTDGLSNIKLLLKLNQAVTVAGQIYKHYLAYPVVWNPEIYRNWKKKAEILHNKLK